MKFRHEYKHIINTADRLILKNKLSKIFDHDLNCKNDGTYFIKSLYFDNYSDTALREKTNGVSCREKFRIRYYNDDTSFIRLEKKSKIGGLCNKQSAPISIDECREILNGKTDFLMDSGCELKKELYAKMKYLQLVPKAIVGYRRESFVYAPGNVRITLDYDIGGSYDVQSFFIPTLPLLSTYHLSVLEVKWDEYLPDIVRLAVQAHSRKSTSFSKYAAVRI